MSRFPHRLKLHSSGCKPPILTLVLLLTLIWLSNPGYGGEIVLEWSPNDEPDLEGYMVYYGTSSREYSCCIDVGPYTTCVISDSGFEEGQTYYFAATAYDKYGNESEFSAEETYTFSAVDTDADGISDNDEINVYNTDPNKSDSDGDGLNDGAELAYWGVNWYVDYDQDGLHNLLDWDSDGDGYSDRREVYKEAQGADPSDPSAIPKGGVPPVVIHLLFD